MLHSENRSLNACIGDTKIRIAKGAVVVICSNETDDLAVLCLHERKAGDVELKIRGTRIFLRCSEQAIICDQDSGNANFNRVPIRNQRREILPEKQTLSLSQFSIPAALTHFQIEKKLKATGKEKQLAAILKNAAVVHTAFASKGPFIMPP